MCVYYIYVCVYYIYVSIYIYIYIGGHWRRWGLHAANAAVLLEVLDVCRKQRLELRQPHAHHHPGRLRAAAIPGDAIVFRTAIVFYWTDVGRASTPTMRLLDPPPCHLARQMRHRQGWGGAKKITKMRH